MLEDIGRQYANSAPLEFIIITGDLAYSGQEEEYRLVEAFLEELLALTGVSRQRLMLVPGNHDIDRNRETDAFHGARDRLKNIRAVDEFLGDTDRKKTLFRRQAAFRTFANHVCDRELYSESSCHTVTITNTGSIKVAAMHIDSAWLCEGGRHDGHAIVVGERQLIDMVAALPSSALTIGLMHHPISWLAPFEHSPIENLISESCHLLFRGHVHEDSVNSIQKATGRVNVFTAGASYESRLSRNCYGYGSLNMLDGRGQCTIHRYRNDTKSWVKEAPTNWNLLDQSLVDAPSNVSLRDLLDASAPYPYYLASLLRQDVAEIPVVYDDSVLFLNSHTDVASGSELAGCIRQMQHVLHWRDCWEPALWEAETGRLLNSYAEIITGVEKIGETREGLVQRDSDCRRLFDTGPAEVPGPPAATNLLEQVESLAVSQNYDMALSILSRARDENLLSSDESKIATRLQIKILLSMGEFDDANEVANRLTADGSFLSEDQVLIGLCRFDVGSYESAADHLKIARKFGATFEEVKGLAMRIAGQTGDTNLLDELSAENG